MKLQIHLAFGIILALATFGVMTTSAFAGTPVTDAHQLRPGTSDFAAAGATAVAPQVTNAHPSATGLSDFGIVGNTAALDSVSAPEPTTAPARYGVAHGFVWADAGVGAAATLGLVLVIAGLGAALVHRRQPRKELRGA